MSSGQHNINVSLSGTVINSAKVISLSILLFVTLVILLVPIVIVVYLYIRGRCLC